jgi:hypothetical protein
VLQLPEFIRERKVWVESMLIHLIWSLSFGHGVLYPLYKTRFEARSMQEVVWQPPTAL